MHKTYRECFFHSANKFKLLLFISAFSEEASVKATEKISSQLAQRKSTRKSEQQKGGNLYKQYQNPSSAFSTVFSFINGNNTINQSQSQLNITMKEENDTSTSNNESLGSENSNNGKDTSFSNQEEGHNKALLEISENVNMD